MFWRLVWTVIPVAAITPLISAVLSSDLSSATTATGGAAQRTRVPGEDGRTVGRDGTSRGSKSYTHSCQGGCQLSHCAHLPDANR